MKKLLFFSLILLVTMLVSSLPAYSCGVQDFEDIPWCWGDSMLGWLATRDFNNYNDIQINSLNPHNGNYSLMVPLVDTMPFGQLHWWLLCCKSAYWSNGICLDSVFMHEGIGYGSHVTYWIYIPAGAPVDSIIVFNRDSDWTWCDFGKYMSGDLSFGAWNNLIAPVGDTNNQGDTIDLPIIQFDVWIFTDSALLNPGCTLYMDDIRTICDWDDSNGVELPQKSERILKITKNLINCIEYSLSSSAHILIEIFNVSGQKVAVKVPGKQLEGPHSIYVDLPAGIYLAKVTANKEKGVSKFISVE